MISRKKYAAISSAIAALNRSWDANDIVNRDRWLDRIDDITATLPSGSGIDAGSSIDTEKSKPDRIVINLSFHHMTEHGVYDGWTEHEIIATPSLAFGFNVRVTGRNRNDIKAYLGDIFAWSLDEDIEL